MSSLRNVTKRRTHKERAQPSERRHLGLLEKRKDYRERSDNYKKRTKRMAVLEKKAAERNPDEFYRAMTKETTREEARKTHGAVAKMKDEDLRLVAMRKVMADRKVSKLRATLHDTAAAPTLNEHTFFVDDDDDDDALRQRASRRVLRSTAKANKKQQRRAYARLDAALDRKDDTARAYDALRAEKVAMTAKGRKRKVKDAEDGLPAVFKWKKQRKN